MTATSERGSDHKDFHAHRHLCFVEWKFPEDRRVFRDVGHAGALNHRIERILGECGGNCMCATCHFYVDLSFLNRIPAAKDNEKFMLSIAAEGPDSNSRLSCQIKMTEELDGIIVGLPGKQK